MTTIYQAAGLAFVVVGAQATKYKAHLTDVHYNAVNHEYNAGKGTQGRDGAPYDDDDHDRGSDRMSVAIIGAIIGSVIVSITVVVFSLYFYVKRERKRREQEPCIDTAISKIAESGSRNGKHMPESTYEVTTKVQPRLRQLPTLPSDMLRRSLLPDAINLREMIRCTTGLIPKSSLIRYGVLGTGHFGTVYSGVVRKGDADSPVAIKVPSNTTTMEDFAREAEIIKQLNHSNIVAFLGLVEGPQMAIVMELMGLGDLKSYLRQAKEDKQSVSLAEKYYTSFQIARGMTYLAHNGVIHRDLAARNCMVASADVRSFGFPVVKVADFGLSRPLAESTDYYCMESNGALPVPWMAPECISQKKFSVPSDVWSFGVTLWEIFSDAQNNPYKEINVLTILKYLCDGNRLKRPINCPKATYDTMNRCWREQISHRPDFNTLALDMATSFKHQNTQSIIIKTLENGEINLDVSMDARKLKHTISVQSNQCHTDMVAVAPVKTGHLSGYYDNFVANSPIALFLIKNVNSDKLHVGITKLSIVYGLHKYVIFWRRRTPSSSGLIPTPLIQSISTATHVTSANLHET
eukprot:CFRG8473T1